MVKRNFAQYVCSFCGSESEVSEVLHDDEPFAYCPPGWKVLPGVERYICAACLAKITPTIAEAWTMVSALLARVTDDPANLYQAVLCVLGDLAFPPTPEGAKNA